MQVSTFKQTKANTYFAFATTQLISLIEQLSVLKNADNRSFIQLWNQENALGLPNGNGEVIGTYPDYTIVIRWGSGETCETLQRQLVLS